MCSIKVNNLLLRRGACLIFCLYSTIGLAQMKRRIAISEADPIGRSLTYGYQRNSSETYQRSALENKIVDAMVSNLSSQPGIIVVDRQKTQEILQEQNNKEDERFDASSGVKLGRLLGADVLIFVRVESYSANTARQRSDKVLYAETKIVGDVQLTATARALSVESESVLAAPSSSVNKQEVLQKTRDLNANAVSAYGRQNSSMDSQPGLVKLIDSSINEVSKDLSAKLVSALGAAAPARIVVPKVAGIDNGQVLLNRGATSGIKVGDIFQITRMQDSGFKDPDTNQPIVRKRVICTLTISSIEDSVSLGTCPGGVPTAGDMAISGGVK
jgi:curli biogenesis system outer membrane secretion channel CsgG